MKFKTTLFIFVLLIAVCLIYSGDRYRTDKNQRMMDAITNPVNLAPINIAPVSVVFLQELAGPFSVDSITVGPEISTQLTGFGDYKTNGEVNAFIQVDPSSPGTLQAIDVQADSLDPQGVTTRRTKFAFSTDAGNTWAFATDVPDGRRSGFCVLHLRNGAAVIANHNIFPNSVLDALLYVDVAPLAATFTEYQNATHAPFGIWPQIAVLSNGNVAMLSRRNVSGNGAETLYVNIWNGTSLGPRQIFYDIPDNYVATVGSNMQFKIASNGAGLVTGVAFPVLANDTLFAGKMISRTSTDNGSTWGPITTVFRPYTQGADTIAAEGGIDVKYKPNSSIWFMSYIEAKEIAGGGVFASAVLKVRRSDGNITTLTDAATVGAASEYNQAIAFVFSIDNPSIGFSRDGKAMYCVYTVVKPDTSRGFNQRDLYFQYSFNDAATWSSPMRLTNNITIDEAYPSVSDWNKGNSATNENYELNFVYMKDLGVGPSTFNGTGTLAPASRNTLIYRKITFGPPIGINGNNSVIKEFSLSQNYPNPFNPVTKITFAIPGSSNVTLKVYDIMGRYVTTLINNKPYKTGEYDVDFNGENLSSGVYFYTINAENFNTTKKMILIK